MLKLVKYLFIVFLLVLSILCLCSCGKGSSNENNLTSANVDNITEEISTYNKIINNSNKKIYKLTHSETVDLETLKLEYFSLIGLYASEYFFKKVSYDYYMDDFEYDGFDYIIKEYIDELSTEALEYFDEEEFVMMYTQFIGLVFDNYASTAFNPDLYNENNDKKPDVNKMWDRYVELALSKYSEEELMAQETNRIFFDILDESQKSDHRSMYMDGDYDLYHSGNREPEDYDNDNSSSTDYFAGFETLSDNKNHSLNTEQDRKTNNLPIDAKNDNKNNLDLSGEAQKADSYYILPGSDSRYIDESELYGFSAEDCRLARNELYARHGRKFNSADLQDYFNLQDWYVPTLEPDEFSDSMFNAYEKANRDLIVAYEKAQGYR